jgi:hypothetical protein
LAELDHWNNSKDVKKAKPSAKSSRKAAKVDVAPPSQNRVWDRKTTIQELQNIFNTQPTGNGKKVKPNDKAVIKWHQLGALNI